MQPNKDGDKLLCIAYKSFLERRKQGFSKSDAAFEDGYFSSDTYLSKWNEDDIDDTLNQLRKEGMVKCDIIGNFSITEEGLGYMESRFKDRLDSIIDYISKLTQIIK